MNEPIVEIDKNGSKRYYLNDKLHRVNGPAAEWGNGDKSWWINSKRVERTTQEQILHNETIKLGSITQFIDFIARCDILLL